MFLVLVIAAILPPICMKDYWIGLKASWSCEASTSRLTLEEYGSFPVIRFIAAVFDKKTRLIKRKMAYTKKVTLMQTRYWTYGVEGDEEFDFNVVSIGFYAAFLRVTSERKNENPVTNVFLVNQTEFDGSPLQPAGTGYDFSTMYNMSPTVPYFDLVDRNKNAYVRFDANCNQTNGWVANEGYYKYDLETSEWTAIYYDPMNTDFYY